MKCAAAPALEAGAVDQSSGFADEGTAAHSLACLALTEGKEALDYLGTVIKVGNNA